MSYVELHTASAFSFLRGASFPEQLAARAAELELPAVALLDRNGVYGAQRFSVACREHGVRPIIGADLTMECGAILPVLVENRAGYKNLCELLTQAHLRSPEGKLRDSVGRIAGVWRRVDSPAGERTRPACLRPAPRRTAALPRRAASKEVCGGAPQTAREARALPGISRTTRSF